MPGQHCASVYAESRCAKALVSPAGPIKKLGMAIHLLSRVVVLFALVFLCPIETASAQQAGDTSDTITEPVKFAAGDSLVLFVRDGTKS